MQCNHCGTFVQEDDQFCGTCGMPVERAPEPAPPPKKKKRTGLIVGILLGVLALAAGGFGAWWFLWGPAAKVTVYVMTEISQYDENGVNTSHVAMEYNDRGMLLSQMEDNGTWEWDEEAQYWIQVSDELDGVFDDVRETDYDSEYMVIGGEYADYQYEESHRFYSYDYEYNSRKLIEEIINTYSWSDEEEQEITYSIDYDSDDRAVEVRSKAAGESTQRYLEVEYDSEGRVETYVDYANEIKIRYRYDEDGRMTEQKYYGKDGETSAWEQGYTIKYSYNDKGQLTEVEADGDDNSMSCKCKYNDKGKLISVVVYADEEKLLQMKYDYDGRKITGGEINVYEDENITDIEMTYDDNGNLVEMEQEDGSYIRIKYKKLRLSRADAQRYYEENELISDMSGMYMSGGFFDIIALPANPIHSILPFNRD